MKCLLRFTVTCGVLLAMSLPLRAGGIVPMQAQVSITDINLNWFGLNGNPNNNLGSEKRATSVRQFLVNEGLLADVMVFEEIVDLKLLQTTVLDNAYQCHSYTRKDPKHQHVVVCHTAQYTFDIAEGASGYALESVDITGGLRPAVHGILKDASGKRIAHLFAVHLKARPDLSPMRMQQVSAISTYLDQEVSKDPVIVVGDFNTYNSDPEDISQAWAKFNIGESEAPQPYTWASATENFAPTKFDRTWMSASLHTLVTTDVVVGPCSSGDTQAIASYNSAVSDHCAVHFAFSK